MAPRQNDPAPRHGEERDDAQTGGALESWRRCRYSAEQFSRWSTEAPTTLRLSARRRVDQGGRLSIVHPEAVWKASETAIIVCDMWDDHSCLNSVRGLEAMIPEMKRVGSGARALGASIIHAPSGTMDFFPGTPQRERMSAAPHVAPSVPIPKWCYLDPDAEGPLPIKDENLCDDAPVRERKRFYSRQHPEIDIALGNGISDDGQEVFNYFRTNRVNSVVLMGVHTNKCVLGRPFGIRQQVRLGHSVALARDLTESMYGPRDEPFVSHERGTELVIEHIERYWCPSIVGDDLTRAAAHS